MLTIDEYYGWINFSIRGPGLCGCGDPESVLDLLHGFLKKLNTVDKEASGFASQWLHERTSTDDSNPLCWLFYYWVGNMELCDHGVSARCPWLTNIGKDIIDAMDRFGTDLDKLEKLRKDPGKIVLPKWCGFEEED